MTMPSKEPSRATIFKIIINGYV